MIRPTRLYRAFKLGVRDGLEAPYDLGLGVTYADYRLQPAYDLGLNIGQRAVRIWDLLTKPLNAGE